MADIPFIDLHPDKIRGTGPETALLACRHFLEQCLKRGLREVRIITGLGIHGDGTPRLRSRVEREVLAGFHSVILAQHYEQQGAVIRLELARGQAKPGKKQAKSMEKEKQHSSYVNREERLMVAFERLDAARDYLDEGDLRRCRLKLNQIVREFFSAEAPVGAEAEALEYSLASLRKRIEALS